MLPMQGPWVRSVVRKLRSHIPHGAAKKKKKKIQLKLIMVSLETVKKAAYQ